MLKKIADDPLADKSLANIRLATMRLIGFAGFFGYSKLANIHLSDIEKNSSHLTIKVRESKGDQLREGDEVVIARAGSSHCPIAMLERYMEKAGITLGSEDFLFWGIIRGKIQTLRPTGNLSYTRFSELLKQKLQDLGFPPVEFSPHSLRSGGATAVAGAGIPDRIFKCHGCWKSENAKDGYVKNTLENRLSVTKNLGLGNNGMCLCAIIVISSLVEFVIIISVKYAFCVYCLLALMLHPLFETLVWFSYCI